MKDTALYEQLLGLKTPWSVRSVDLTLADQRVVVEIVLKKGQVQEMSGFGHFPMVENPDGLLPFLRAPLGTLRARAAQVQGDAR